MNKDYVNGLVAGLMTRGLKFGNPITYTPTITNSDTVSFTIDFGVNISDFSLQSLKEAMYVQKKFGSDQNIVNINGWSRVDAQTIKFDCDNYFSCNGYILISYIKTGVLSNVPKFTVEYLPTGVPLLIYYREIHDLNITIGIVNLVNSLTDAYNSSSFTPTAEDTLTGDISSLTISVTSTGNQITNNLSDSNYSVVLS